jgi:hypothetical protein
MWPLQSISQRNISCVRECNLWCFVNEPNKLFWIIDVFRLLVHLLPFISLDNQEFTVFLLGMKNMHLTCFHKCMFHSYTVKVYRQCAKGLWSSGLQWGVIVFSVVTNVLEEHTAFTFSAEVLKMDEIHSSKMLVTTYMASQPRWSQSTFSLPWESQISLFKLPVGAETDERFLRILRVLYYHSAVWENV